MPTAATWSDNKVRSSPPGLCTAPPTSATATTRMPAEDRRKARGPPTFPKPCTMARAPATGMPRAANTARTQRTTPEAVAPVCRRIPPTDRGLPVTTSREGAALHHAERVEQPRHDPLVGVHVGCGDVAVGAQQRRDLEGVATGEAFELGRRQLTGVAAHAALAPAKGDVDDGGLERHVGGQGGDLGGVQGRGGSGSRPWPAPAPCCGGCANRGTPRRGRRPSGWGRRPRAPGRAAAGQRWTSGSRPAKAAASSMRSSTVAHGSYWSDGAGDRCEPDACTTGATVAVGTDRSGRIGRTGSLGGTTALAPPRRRLRPSRRGLGAHGASSTVSEPPRRRAVRIWVSSPSSVFTWTTSGDRVSENTPAE